MRFLIEDIGYKIRINKYRKEDLKLTEKGVWIFGSDEYSQKNLRLPKLPYRKKFIYPEQICDYGDYLYIPDDQIPRDDMIFTWTKPVDSKVIGKDIWKRWKDKNPYNFK